MQKILWITLLAACLFLGLAGAGFNMKSHAAEETAQPGGTYTAYNLWYEKPERMYCVNYHTGSLIPAGSKVTHFTISGKTIEFGLAEGGSFTIHFAAKFHPGLSIQQYCDRLFVGEPIDKKLEGFTPEERDLIKTGSIAPGMSADAVIVSWGYPCEHRTPTRSARTWVYWYKKMSEQFVNFDDKGKVSSWR